MTDGTEILRERITGIRVSLRGAFDESPAVGVARKKLESYQAATYNAQRELEQAIRDTKFFQQFNAMTGKVSIALPTGSMDYGSLTLKPEQYGAWGIEQVETTPVYPHVNHLDPKTLNTLLTGKLLTPEEKRALLKSQGVDLTALATPNT